jgi:hypothetical protein
MPFVLHGYAYTAQNVPGSTPASPPSFTELKIAGYSARSGGTYDPSLEYGPDGTGWMAFSIVEVPNRVHTAVAKSTDAGKTWQQVALVNKSEAAWIQDAKGEKVAGVWRHEVSALVYDPGDAGKTWKLYWHKYFATAAKEERLLDYGWIACRCAASPEGPWSEEVAQFGAGAFPRAPYKARVDLASLHAEMADYIVFTEPGALYRNGTLFLSLQAHPKSAVGAPNIVLIASADHGTTWTYCGTLLKAAESKSHGGDFFTGSSLAVEKGRVFLLVCPEVKDSGMLGHRGTAVFEIADLAKGALKRDGNGVAVLVKQLKPTLKSGGQSDYDERNTAGGIIMPQFDMANLPLPWRLFNTHQTILGE